LDPSALGTTTWSASRNGRSLALIAMAGGEYGREPEGMAAEVSAQDA
jgi:hypothetical protein